MRPICFVLLTFLPLNSRGFVSAADSTDSFALLVRTVANSDNQNVQAAVLQGMLKGLSGRRNIPAPEGWSELALKLANSDRQDIRDFAEQLSQIFGDQEAMKRSLALVRDKNADPELRRKAMKSLLTQRNEAITDDLPALLDQPELRLDAIRGFGVFDLPKAPELLLSLYANFSDQEQRAVIETLASRKTYAAGLVDALKSKVIDRKEIPVYVARSLHEIVGEEFTEVYGKIPELKQDTRKLITKYRGMIEPKLSMASAAKGRAVFDKTCANCHLMYGEGGKIGPDLTGSNRANLDYILLNSLAPSEDVPEGYRMVIIATDDGRVFNGVIGEEDEQRIVLKTVDQPALVILKEEIVARKVSPKSMMPDGQLQQLPEQDVIDLIKYLRTTEQVEIAK